MAIDTMSDSHPSTNFKGVRLARPTDILSLVEMCASLHAESSFRDIAIDKNKLQRLINASVSKNGDGVAVFVYEEHEIIIGFVFGYISEYFFSKQTLAQDLIFYVVPEKRGIAAAERLWTKFRDWAQSKGVAELSMGVSTQISEERTGAFLERMGMSHIGGLFKIKLK